MTWQELLNEGEKRLSKKGVPEAKLNAWYLFSDCFETSKSDFFLNQELETESEKTERFLALIAKRCERIPLEYLLGETEFMGLPFLVNENVLIPRQDTECLVEEVLKNDPGYYSWIMNGDFPLNTKKILTEIKLRGFNSK